MPLSNLPRSNHITASSMILTAIFAMLQTGEVFNPSDLNKFDMPENLRHKRLISSAKEAVALLVSLGLVPEDSISLEPLSA